MKSRSVRRKVNVGREKTSLFTKVILFFLFGILLIEIFVTWNMISTIKEKVRPANLDLVSISDSSCIECTTVRSLSSLIENNNNTKIKSMRTLDFSSQEAKSLIQQYGIQKIPAVIVTGEFKKENIVFLWGQLKGRMLDTAVVIEANPPYVNASNENKEGLATLLTIVDSSCKDCVTMDTFVSSLKQAGVKFVREKTLEYNTTEAQAWISSQNIQRIPAIVLSKDVEAYDTVKQFLIQTNATQRQGFYAYDATTPPYINLSTGKIVGLVSVIYITDSSCSTCYDVNTHKTILPRFGLKVVNESTYDINNTIGTQLLAQYNITKVPTILVSPDAGYYLAFEQVWPTAGTVASDGWFVFRGTEQMGVYKDLSSGKVVTPQQ